MDDFRIGPHTLKKLMEKCACLLTKQPTPKLEEESMLKEEEEEEGGGGIEHWFWFG